MYAVSDSYKTSMKRPVQRHRIKGTIGTVPFTEDHILSGSFTISGQCSDNSMVQIGQVYTAELKITLLRKLGLYRYTLKGMEIAPHFGLSSDGREYEYIPLGIFTVSKASWGASGVEITAYDNMSKLDRSFTAKNLSGTPYSILKLACTSCGLELDMKERDFQGFANGTRVLSLYAENNIENWRDCVGWVAQALACNVFADRKGRIYLRAYSQEAVDEIDTEHRFNGATFGDYETRYTGVSVVNMEDQMTNYYAMETDDGLTYNLGSNPFMQGEDSEAMCREVLSAMGQILYVPFSVDMIGNPAYDLMDVLRFKGGFADGDKLSCITKYTFHYNAKYSCAGVGSDPALATANSKSDKNIAGLMAQVTSITSSINRLIYDYNTGPLIVGQDEQTIGMLTYYISKNADVEGHFLMYYVASEATRLILRFYDQGTEELYSPLEMDIPEGEGSVGIPHAYLNRQVGIHSVYVTAQVYSGELSVDTRGAFFTIDAGNFAEPVDDINMDVRDITLRQLMESNGPDQVWIAGIEDGKMLVSRRAYSENYTSNPKWEGVYTPGKALDVALEFDGTWVLRAESDRFTLETEDQPWYFWIDENHDLLAQHGEIEDTRLTLASNAASVQACRGYSSTLFPDQDQGLIVGWLDTEGRAFYRQYVLNTATGEKQWLGEIPLEASEKWDDFRIHRLNDYRVSFILSNSSHNLWLISERTYVNQAVPPERKTEYVNSDWNGISVVDPAHSYRGTERSFEGDTRQTVFIIDFASDVGLYEKPQDIITTTVNGNAYDGKYTFKTEGNSLVITFEEPLSGLVAITVKAWVHYLMGNGVNYMFTDSTTYNWEVVNRISAPVQYEEREDVIGSNVVRISILPIKTLKVSQKETRQDDLQVSSMRIDVKELKTGRYASEESRSDVLAGAGIRIMVTQTGDKPI